MAKKDKDDELRSVLREVQDQLGSVLEVERAKLAKASPGEATSPEVPADTSATSPKDDEASASESSPQAPDSLGGGAEGTPPDADAAGAGADAGDSGGEYLSDPQELKAEYAKLPLEVLKAHYLGAKAALWEVTGQDASGAGASDAGAGAPATDGGMGASAPMPPDAGQGAGAPPALPPGPGGPGDPPPMTQKAELSINAAANGGAVRKSEREVRLEAELKKTQDLLNGLAALTTKIVERPVRKAVTALSQVAETKPKIDPSKLSKTEVIARLNEKTRNGELKKSDRELITSYCVGSVDVSKIAHLLTE